jgi:hypothetical protein
VGHAYRPALRHIRRGRLPPDGARSGRLRALARALARRALLPDVR